MFFAKSLMTLMTLDTHDTRPLIFPTSRCISFFVAMKIYFCREAVLRSEESPCYLFDLICSVS